MKDNINSNGKSKINWTAGITAILSALVNTLVYYEIIPRELAFDVLSVLIFTGTALVIVFRSLYTKPKPQSGGNP